MEGSLRMGVMADVPVISDIDMMSFPPTRTIRATVVQASTVFYDTPATLGINSIYCAIEKRCFRQ
mgnify:CR=1 FL=1